MERRGPVVQREMREETRRQREETRMQREETRMQRVARLLLADVPLSLKRGLKLVLYRASRYSQ